MGWESRINARENMSEKNRINGLLYLNAWQWRENTSLPAGQRFEVRRKDGHKTMRFESHENAMDWISDNLTAEERLQRKAAIEALPMEHQFVNYRGVHTHVLSIPPRKVTPVAIIND